MVWFMIPVAGCVGAAGTIYGLHAVTNATSIYIARALHGIDGAYTWPPLAMAFDDRTQEQNGTVLGTMAAGAVAIPTYAIVMRGIRGSMRSAASTVQPAKVESFAQLARSIAPGMGQRGIAAVAAAVVAGAVRPAVDGNNME